MESSTCHAAQNAAKPVHDAEPPDDLPVDQAFVTPKAPGQGIAPQYPHARC